MTEPTTEEAAPEFVPSTQVPRLLGTIGWLVALSGLFYGAYLAADTREVAAILPGLVVVGLGLLLVGVAEMVNTLFAIERNTRDLADEARRAMESDEE